LLRADPLSIDLQRLVAYVQVSAGGYEQSIALGRHVLAADLDHRMRGRCSRALSFITANVMRPSCGSSRWARGITTFSGILRRYGRRAEAEALAAKHRDFPARLALIYAGLGDADRTFDALERMTTERHPLLGIYLTYPELAFLRADPGLPAFRRDVGLPN
jgi:hypothetical protein